MKPSAGAGGRWLAAALPWALLALFVMRGVAAMQVDGTTADEPIHLFYGARALASGTFLRENDTLNSKMPVSILNAVPVAVAGRRGALDWPRQLFLARLPTLLLGALLGLLVWRWAQALFGGWSGSLALFLYTFCPNVLAHSHLVTTDVSTALGMFAATWCLWRYLERPGAARLAAAGAAFGGAQLTKATALFLLPIFAVILLLRSLRETARERAARGLAWGGALRRLAARTARDGLLLAFLCLAAVIVLNLGFCFEGSGTPLGRYAMESDGGKALAAAPVLRALPLPLPYAYVQGLDMVGRDSSAESWSYLHGRYSLRGFRSYFLAAFLVKVPLGTQLLLVLAAWLWLTGRVRAPGSEELLVVPVVLLTAYLSLLFRLDIGLRYLLPAFPFLFVFIGRVAAPAPPPQGQPWQGGARPARLDRWRPAVCGALLLWVALDSWSIHPHYLAYFNELAGGPDQGWRWLIDSNLDWNQDQERARADFASHGRPLLVDPSGPLAGRIAVGVTQLVGRDPGAAERHAWLRDHFQPTAVIGHSWAVFDVAESDLDRCCAGLPRAWALEDLAGDLALGADAFGGADGGVVVRFQERLNDGMLGANDFVDAPRTTPPLGRPVRAWFGVRWPAPQRVGRVLAFPGFYSRGPMARKFLAVDYVFQWWDGRDWQDIPGTRVTGNQALHVEHRFPPLRTTAIRLLIERERNDQGRPELEGGFRAACLELAAYSR